MKSKKSNIALKIILSVIIVILLVCIGFMAKLVLIDSKTADSNTEDTRIAQDESGDKNGDARESKSEKSSKKSGNVLMSERESVSGSATEINGSGNALMADSMGDIVIGSTSDLLKLTVLGSEYVRGSVVSITFLDSLDNMPSDAWDVSANGDGSVMAWVTVCEEAEPSSFRTMYDLEAYDLYIAGNGGVDGNPDCSYLFYHYDADTINFNGCFYTENVTNMNHMFANTGYISLDLSGFDTSKVTDMGQMFYSCAHLAELDLSSFSTSNVTSMIQMFTGCLSLEKLNVTSFDTSNVETMYQMFYNCKSLVELDISNFNMTNVTNDELMLKGVEGEIIK